MRVETFGQMVTCNKVKLKNGDTRCYGNLLVDGRLYEVQSFNNEELHTMDKADHVTLEVTWGGGANGKWVRAIVVDQ